MTLESVFMKENTTIMEQLTVKSPADLEPGNMQVKVTAIASATSNTETSIFTLDIVIVKPRFLRRRNSEGGREHRNGQSSWNCPGLCAITYTNSTRGVFMYEKKGLMDRVEEEEISKTTKDCRQT